MLAERSGIECTQSGSEADPTEFSSAEPASVTDNGKQDQLNASRVNRLFQLLEVFDPSYNASVDVPLTIHDQQ